MKKRKVTTKRGSVTCRAAQAQLRKRLKVIGAERDVLRELFDDIAGLLTTCDDAADGIETAIDALSRYA